MTTLTIESLRALLDERFGGMLRAGKHSSSGDGKCCTRELRSAALGLPWSDHPDNPNWRMGPSTTDIACHRLNDAAWSSDAARTKGCLPLALLSEETAKPGWSDRYREQMIRQVLPIALRAWADLWGKALPFHSTAMLTAALKCETDGTPEDARAARDAAQTPIYDRPNALSAVVDIYHAARYAEFDGAQATVHAALSVATSSGAAAGDQLLTLAVKLLVEAQRGEES